MAPCCSVFTRRSDDDGTTISTNTTQLIGVCIAAAIAAAGALWLGFYFYRKRVAAQREKQRASTFFSVHTAVKDAQLPLPLPDPASSQMQMRQAESTKPVARAQLTASVIMPERAVLRTNATRDEIIAHYTAEGSLPRPFVPFAQGSPSGSKRSSARSSLLRPISTASFLSVGSSYSSRRGSTMSSLSVFDEDHKRRVRQLFNPTLPDELVLKLGERVTVVSSFEDGWCIVGRDSMLTPDKIELGAVPAWVFVKPVKGLKAERPIRTSSLGVTVTLDGPGIPRQEVISWSNFS